MALQERHSTGAPGEGRKTLGHPLPLSQVAAALQQALWGQTACNAGWIPAHA